MPQRATKKTRMKKSHEQKKKKTNDNLVFGAFQQNASSHRRAKRSFFLRAREPPPTTDRSPKKVGPVFFFARAQKVIDREALFFFVGERKGRDFLFESDQSIHHGVRFKIGPRNGGIIVIFEATGAAAATTDELRSRHFERCREVEEQQRAKRRRRYVSPSFFRRAKR